MNALFVYGKEFANSYFKRHISTLSLAKFGDMRSCLILLFVLLNSIVGSQEYPKGYFKSPIDITWRLSGNFGELRPNHFHAGVDITTQGKEGYAIRASAEGYISRIKISPWGYGKAIYVTHPNGYTTVYAHLRAYSGKIAEWVKKQQYLAESFEIELFPAEGELSVTQGMQIGESGNTGSSGGPHLHFEIRDSKTEEAINPLLFGFPVGDTVAPVPVTLAVYELSDNSYVNGKSGMKKIPLSGGNKKYSITNKSDSVIAFGEIGFGIEAYDKENIAQGKNGVYSIQLFEGKKLLYSHTLDRIPFEDSRYINCFVDYEEHEKTGKYFQLSYLASNNRLPVYDSVVNRGRILLNDGKLHSFRYVVKDVFGNTSNVDFRVRARTSNPETQLAASNYKPMIQVLTWSEANLIEENEFTFSSPAEAFYENHIFKWKSTPPSGNKLSSTIVLMDRFTPIHKVCTLAIKPTATISDPSKIVMVREKSDGKLAVIATKWNGTAFEGETKDFGTYYLLRDTVAPVVRGSNFDVKGIQTDFSAMKSIQIKIGDNLSGIKTYRGTIDGKWVLFEYEPKKDLLTHTFESGTAKGKHELELVVTDACDNQKVFTKEFDR